ncbi:MAG: hypothetical protein ACRYF2_20570 [Janthinobacterium lividum]
MISITNVSAPSSLKGSAAHWRPSLRIADFDLAPIEHGVSEYGKGSGFMVQADAIGVVGELKQAIGQDLVAANRVGEVLDVWQHWIFRLVFDFGGPSYHW